MLLLALLAWAALVVLRPASTLPAPLDTRPYGTAVTSTGAIAPYQGVAAGDLGAGLLLGGPGPVNTIPAPYTAAEIQALLAQGEATLRRAQDPRQAYWDAGGYRGGGL